ncbi:envelope glycoprotein H [pteropodid alphaherpesvirus 2]|uniref:Envelope glycoprotein H n=1 Tax=pteropodid alphaherpesvirus 2 TaxID=3118716 RepID=A0A510J7C0_9ALPH|nr:envelope glycoprotein H [pteropodid alphaherpesvirus 2]BBM13194.1 envelope glycoprotein H [pteropodid alphaherpesvirus 2]
MGVRVGNTKSRGCGRVSVLALGLCLVWGLWGVVGLVAGNDYWEELEDPWFGEDYPEHADKYQRAFRHLYLWIPNIPVLKKTPLGILAPPPELGLNITTLPLLQWARPTFCFFLVTTRQFPQDPGKLFYIPQAALLGLPVNASLPQVPPSVRTPLPNRDVFQLRGLRSPATSLWLQPRVWVSYAPIRDYKALMFRRGPKAATPEFPHGRLHISVGKPPATGVLPTFSHLTTAALAQASTTWINSTGIFRSPHRFAYQFPSSATWPAVIWRTGEFELTCNAARVRAQYGHRFMGLVISSKSATPAEVIVVPASEELLFTGPPLARPARVLPGPPKGPRYRVFVVSSVDSQNNATAIAALQEMAAYPEESSNYAQHLSRAYAVFFQYALETPNPTSQALVFWRISSLLATAGFSFINTVQTQGAVRFADLLSFLTHTRVLARLAAQMADCATNTLAVRASFFREAVSEEIYTRLTALLSEVVTSEESIASHASAYQLAFVLGNPSAYDMAAPSAAHTLYALHAEFVRGHPLNTAAVRRALYYGLAVILSPMDFDTMTPEQRARGRKSLLLATSLCTAQAVTATNTQLQAALQRVDHRRQLFFGPDYVSPCAMSCRFDLTEDNFVLDTLALLPRGNLSVEETEHQTRGVASALTRWRYHNTVIRAFVPEAVVECLGPHSNAEPLIILPVTPNASFVLTHLPIHRGVEYRLAGVDVQRPLFLTFLTASCTGRMGEIESKRLVRPETHTDLGLVGTVFLRYTPAGEVLSVLAIDTDDAQQQLSGVPIPGQPNIFNSDVPSTALLLFPNSSVIHLLAFDIVPSASISTSVAIMSTVGVVLIAATIAGTVRALWSCVPFFWRLK